MLVRTPLRLRLPLPVPLPPGPGVNITVFLDGSDGSGNCGKSKSLEGGFYNAACPAGGGAPPVPPNLILCSWTLKITCTSCGDFQ